jgi:hypothetical protein
MRHGTPAGPHERSEDHLYDVCDQMRAEGFSRHEIAAAIGDAGDGQSQALERAWPQDETHQRRRPS